MKKRIRKEETEEQEQMVSVTQEELTALRGRPDITQEEYENLLVAQTRLNTIENNTKSWCSGCQTNHSSWTKHYEAKCWNCNKWSLVPNNSLIVIKHQSGKKHYKEGLEQQEWVEIERSIQTQQAQQVEGPKFCD